MSADPRAELAELSRLLQTNLAWQRDLGASELPRVVAAPRPDEEPIAAPRADEEPIAAPRPDEEPIAAPRADAGAPPRAPIAEPAAPAGPRRALSRVEALAVIQAEVQGCTACKLAARRHNTVFARGNPDARLVFIGEGPGENEDRLGQPFVGNAGELLDKIIVAMSLDPSEVYICNIVKCRPPGNRQPERDEVSACAPFLARQLGVVKPEVIVALGRTATAHLLDSTAPMGKLRGQWHARQGVEIMPTWHPSYLLREPSRKSDTWADMQLVMRRLGLTPPSRT